VPKPPTKRKTTEVVADPSNDRRQRRRYTKDEKLRILREADECSERGELAALLRREGIYSSHLTAWRQQLRAHGEEGLAPKPVGRKPTRDERDRTIDKLERRTAKLEKELLIARKVIELQVKAHEVLGIALPRIEDDGAS
jgi:transposase